MTDGKDVIGGSTAIEPLRIGFVVDTAACPAWQVDLIESVAIEPGLAAVLLMIVPSTAGASTPAGLALYERLDRIAHRHLTSRFAARDLHEAVPQLPRVNLPGLALAGEAADRCRGARLDAIVALGSRRPPAGLETFARHGVWFARWANGEGLASRLGGLAEMADAVPATPVVLERIDPRGATAAIDSSRTCTHDYSLVKTKTVTIAAAARMIQRSLCLLRDRGVDGLAAADRTQPGDAVAIASPGPLRVPFARFGGNALHRLIERLMWDEFHWSVAIGRRRDATPAEDAIREKPLAMLESPIDRFHADPFLFEQAGAAYLFVERFDYASRLGWIEVCRLDPDGRPGPLATALRQPSHLSYPQVFEWRDEVFMIPETLGKRAVELYRCDRFPDRWSFDRTLLQDLDAADATVLEHAGRLWMFVCVAPRWMLPNTELHLFHADDLRGPWRPHPLNPVVRDVRRARCAGRIVRKGDHWIRPAQDCSIRYGRAISFQRIVTLTVEDYAEEPIAEVTPDRLPWLRGAVGAHTWNSTSEFWVADACVARFRGARWLGRFGGRTPQQ